MQVAGLPDICVIAEKIEFAGLLNPESGPGAGRYVEDWESTNAGSMC